MLSIIYPEGDYTSADIAIRTQALAQGQGQQIYVVPKHYGRNDEVVFKNLAKSTAILFISYDKTKLDPTTARELNFLLDKGKRVHAIVPQNMVLLPKNATIYPYSKANQSEFIQAITNFIANTKTQTVKQSKNDELLSLIGILLLSILFLSLVSTQANGKK